MGDKELPRPLREARSTSGDRMLGPESTKQGSELGPREADKQSLAPGMLEWRSSHPRHDFMISGSVNAARITQPPPFPHTVGGSPASVL
jgi:hypothetical protein